MEDLITVLQFIQRLENAKLVPGEEVEQIKVHLLDSLYDLIGSSRYDALIDLMEALNSLENDSNNPLYIHLTK